MRLRGLISVVSIFFASHSFAQVQGELTQSRVLILLDESSSMLQKWPSGKEKYKAAQDIILKLMDSVYAVNNQVEFSLRVFGHQHTFDEQNCVDTRNEVAFSRDNRTQMALRLDDIRPLGITPIAYSLKEAAERDLIDPAKNAYSIILITDGGESCGGDICAVMNTLMKNKVFFKPYIVSLENDPALKSTYSCMGDFLQVTRQEDVPRAVSTIVNAFRPAIRITKSEYKDLQTTAANAPNVLKVKIPEIKVAEPTDTAKAVVPEVVLRKVPVALTLESVALKLLQIKNIEFLMPEEVADVVLPALVLNDLPAPVIPKIDQPLNLPVLTIRKKDIPGPTAIGANTVKELPAPVPVITDTPVAVVPPRNKETIVKLTYLKPSQIHVAFVLEEHEYQPVPEPALPPLKLPELPVAKTTEKPLPPGKPKPAEEKKAEFTAVTEESKETQVEVLLTNGKGKFYQSTPQIYLMEPKTGKVVKKFWRFVDGDGKPELQNNIAAGTYDLTFPEKRSLVVKNVKIEPNKKNTVTVIVHNSSLSFAYADAPDRPVSEFKAVVIERNKTQGRVQEQACTDLVEYEAGNYHIKINTFPEDVRNADIDFGETVITLPQPGFVKFTAVGAPRNIMLYRRLGDKFLAFYPLDLNNPDIQHMRIQPGEYQVHYQTGPVKTSLAETVVSFLIKPKQETEVTMK